MDIEVNPIRLKRNTKIGELDAESDQLLSDCFFESEEFRAAKDVSNPGSIALGRVGSGKSALLLKLRDECERSIWLDPQSLSFQYIENSAILQFVESLGVNLNTFYKLLWRHVLVVELLKSRFQITDSRIQHNFFESLASKFSGNEKKKKAIEYVQEWGDKFWEETETRVKEVTKRIEGQLGTTLGADTGIFNIEVDGKTTLSQEHREELGQRAKKVVNDIQIRRLGEVLDLLSDEDLLGNSQKKFYILIDGLDNNWANIETRCKLIRALIEEIRTFRQLTSVKIVIALRRDLLSLVYDRTRDSGFQEEKFEALLLEINWSDFALRELVNRRIRTVFERQYSRSRISLDDIFLGAKGGGATPFDYMIQRTLKRPRDIIQFINESFKIATDKARVSMTDVRKAENVYSEKRLKSLQEEWSDVYPSLVITLELLRGASHQLAPSDLIGDRLDSLLTKLWDGNPTDPCVKKALSMTDPASSISREDVLKTVLQVLYQVGVLGIKTDSNDAMCWSSKDQPTMSDGEIGRSNRLRVHRMAWQALNIVPDDRLAMED